MLSVWEDKKKQKKQKKNEMNGAMKAKLTSILA